MGARPSPIHLAVDLFAVTAYGRSMSTLSEKPLTAEQYFQLPDTGRPAELIHGRVVAINPPGVKHGYYCFRLAYLLGRFLEKSPLGRLPTNDSGVITRRDPDTVRGADVAFYSFSRLPHDAPLPETYSDIAPDLVCEVVSPSESSTMIDEKVDEYLQAGVSVVLVVDSRGKTVIAHRSEGRRQRFESGEALTLDDVLPDFVLSVDELFA